MRSTDAWTSRKYHGYLLKSFHFPPFFYGPRRWTCPIFIHAFYYSKKTKGKKNGLYREIERGEIFLFLCPMTHPHYWALCRRKDRNWVLWSKEWPIHPSHNFRFHKGRGEILLYFSFVLGGMLLWPVVLSLEHLLLFWYTVGVQKRDFCI